MRIVDETGDRCVEGSSLNNLDVEPVKAGELGQAITWLQAASKIFEEIEAHYVNRARATLERLESNE